MFATKIGFKDRADGFILTRRSWIQLSRRPTQGLVYATALLRGFPGGRSIGFLLFLALNDEIIRGDRTDPTLPVTVLKVTVTSASLGMRKKK